LHLVLKPARDRYVDIGRPGPSFADYIVYRDNIFRGGKRVGLHGGTCTIIRIVKQGISLNCATTLRLSHGQLTIQGIGRSPLPEGAAVFTFAVTGGTKSYQGATGQATITDHGGRQTVVVHLD
jgi:allene oxide cyclase-like protein